jgi:hypothetical protein
MRSEHRIVTGQTVMMSSVNVLRKLTPRVRLSHRADVSDRATPNAIRVFRRLFGSPEEVLSLRGGRRDLNPQQPEPQSGALPLSYDHHANGEKKSSASSGSAKHIFRSGRGPGDLTFSVRLPSSQNSLQLASRSTIIPG